MSELESNFLYDNGFLYDVEQKLAECIECDVSLGKPIELLEDPRLLQMHSNERRYTEYLLRKGVIVFSEPELVGIQQCPDFFVWKPNTQMWETPYSGFFYELTLCSRADLESTSRYCKKKYARKRRQRELFDGLGLPIIYICREDQERIRSLDPDSNLF